MLKASKHPSIAQFPQSPSKKSFKTATIGRENCLTLFKDRQT